MLINPLGLGFEMAGGFMHEIIPRNVRVPVTKWQDITINGKQEYFLMKVFQGGRALTRDNHFLGAFNLTGLSPGPGRRVKIHVTYELDKNCILKVVADDPVSNHWESILINLDNDGMSPDEVDELIKEAPKWNAEDNRTRNILSSRNELDQALGWLEHAFWMLESKWGVSADERTKVQTVIEETKDLLETNSNENAELYEDKKRMISDIRDKLEERYTVRDWNERYNDL
jgi:heat shock protein 5